MRAAPDFTPDSDPASRAFADSDLPLRLFHGTTRRRAESILRFGFRRGTDPDASYTGTAVNLSESAAVAYEYGDYGNGGCILEVTLRPGTTYSDRMGNAAGDSTGRRFDNWFRGNADTAALRLYFGNVWLVWNTACIQTARLLTKRQATAAVIECMRQDGPDCAYNGRVQDIADAYWARDRHNPVVRRYLAGLGLLVEDMADRG